MKKAMMFLACISVISVSGGQTVQSHNDYKRGEPFWDAYLSGAGIMEAYLWLRDGSIVVCHNRSGISRAPLFEELYVEKLGLPGIDRDDLLIMCELKSPDVMEPLAELLASRPDIFGTGKVEVIISGQRPGKGSFDNYPAYIWFDGRFEEDYSETEIKRVRFISGHVRKFGRRNGKEYSRCTGNSLSGIIADRHSAGLEVRFWGTKDNRSTWKRLRNLGVDVINTDKPARCSAFLSSLSTDDSPCR